MTDQTTPITTRDQAPADPAAPILVTAATGKTGRRVAERLEQAGAAVRHGSRSADLPFDWTDPTTWDAALAGTRAVYLAYVPDLATPGAEDAVRDFLGRAQGHGVRRVVLLSGRGEPEAEVSERTLIDSGLEWTVIRAAWFAQNFSEAFLAAGIPEGEVVLPGGTAPEPFIDADDIAEIATAALLTDDHLGRLYEVTGPRALTFEQALGEIAAAAGREIAYVEVDPAAYRQGLLDAGVQEGEVEIVVYLFGEILDGRNTPVAGGVQEALGRPPRDFADYVRAAALTGAFDAAAQTVGSDR